MLAGLRDCLVRDVAAGNAVDELEIHVAERPLEEHAISAVRPRGEADDEDLLELRVVNGASVGVVPYRRRLKEEL